MATDIQSHVIGDVRARVRAATDSISKGKKLDVSYGVKDTNFEEVAIIQSRQALTPDRPYFFIEVHRCDPNTVISVGIAPQHINRHAGQYNNSLGYHSDTGRIYTSWKFQANTLGIKYGKGNAIGMFVTYFGEHMSTVIIFRDNVPVATRYHFEGNKKRYLPTVTFSGGPCHISVHWPNMVMREPSINEISIPDWVRGSLSTYNPIDNCFENNSKVEDLPIQSPVPLGQTFCYFIVTQEEVSSVNGKGASVGLATCSPLKPTPTCSLMKDYYTWFPKTRLKPGNSIGWGVFYDENCHDDKAEQLCLVFVMFNKMIVDALFVVQPEGGFFPIVLLQPYATRVSIERHELLTPREIDKLRELHEQLLRPAVEIYRKDKQERDLPNNLFRKSEQVLLKFDNHMCRVSVPKTENTIHYLQFCRPLTADRRFFFVELEHIGRESQITVGIASMKHHLNEAPGSVHDSVGYDSFTGKLYSNHKDTGNMQGHKCRQGDTMGVEVQLFDSEMSVVLFSKNFRPIGTRYLTLQNQSQYFPTILIENNGDPVELLVYWQTRVSVPPYYSPTNAEDWCVPDGTLIDSKQKIFVLPQHTDHSLCIQGPCSISKKYKHFEMVLLETFTDTSPPPAIALCTASPLDPPSTSQFRQDYLRFWPTGDAARYLKEGDRIGWGVIYPDEHDVFAGHGKEQLIICYLTVNRTVGYVRVLYQPIGGFYPVVIAPPNINLIQMDFSAVKILTEEFTSEQIREMVAVARQQIDEEDDQLTQTHDLFNVPLDSKIQTSPEISYEPAPVLYEPPAQITARRPLTYEQPTYDVKPTLPPHKPEIHPPVNPTVKSSTCIIV